MVRLRLTMCGVLLLARPAAVQAGEVAGRMRLLARSLQTDFSVKRPGASDVPLAIFEFACNDALAKQRVGSAVAELLKREFVGAAPFRLVERSELDRILKEQAIQQTGLTDANSGVQLGKLVGAKAIVTGSVDKLGSVYQVSARLSDVETADVIAVAVQELPARAFEEEAQPLLTLVPEVQAIGMFVAPGWFLGGSLRNLGPTVVAAGGETHTADLLLRDPKPLSLTVGVRYRPLNALLIEAALTPLGYMETWKLEFTQTPTHGGSVTTRNQDIETGGGSVAAFWIRPLGRRFIGTLGGGVTLVHVAKGTRNGPVDAIVPRDRLFIRPTVAAGIEWRPQRRFGIELRGNVSLTRATSLLQFVTPVGTGDQQADFAELTLPTADVCVSSALYF